jgi:hypothetical protein
MTSKKHPMKLNMIKEYPFSIAKDHNELSNLRVQQIIYLHSHDQEKVIKKLKVLKEISNQAIIRIL